MVRAIGIDPGTKSFDVCGIDNGKVFYEEVLDTSELVEDPSRLIRSIEREMPVDIIAGPSGYGVGLTHLDDLPADILKDWYLTYILLLKREDLEKALSRRDPGIMVYSTMIQNALEMKRRRWPVCYIPGVINLSTVPEWRKANCLDLGTVDKLCSCILGIHDQSVKMNISPRNTSFVLIEMGYGYNSILAVENGKIIDGLGGTTNGMGFLTAGKLDLELVQLVGRWEKADVFTGGAATLSGKDSPNELIRSDDEKTEIALNALKEGVKKGVASVLTTMSEPREILISGRLTRIKEVKDELRHMLNEFATVRPLNPLQGAKKVKEAAQGYAMVAEGLYGGEFSEIVDCTKIRDAEGTALDHIYHPKGRTIKEELKEKVPFRP